MTTSTLTATAPPPGRDDGRADFGHLVHAEWTKFRTVRGWLIGMLLAAVLTVLLGLLIAGGTSIGCVTPGGAQHTGAACLPHIPHGPGGEVVSDSFSFAHRTLTGNGTLIVRLTSLTGEHADLTGGRQHVTGQGPQMVRGLMPWSKAGIIVKASLRQGSAYAAMLATGSHGVRMQYDYVHDTAGLPGRVAAARPRWLRLTRSGDLITGYDSADGRHWIRVGTARLTGLPGTVQVGMFATSPGYIRTTTSFGGQGNFGGPSQATGVFDHVSLSGGAARGGWTGTFVGGGFPLGPAGPGANAAFSVRGGDVTVTGSGDIAPVTPGSGSGLPTATIGDSLAGAFLGLLAIVVVAAMFFTAEFRRGLIAATFAAGPRRGQVLAAKTVVIGGVTFVVGLAACAVAVTVCVPIMRAHGQEVLPVSALTHLRVIVGTAAMLAIAAVFAMAIGAILRRSTTAITLAIGLVVLPFLLDALNAVPSGAGAWLMRLTPAAGLAVEQSIPAYPQVTSASSVVRGSYPLPPWAGFLVLCCYAAAALGLAMVVLRRRDA